MQALVSAQWLLANINNPNLVILYSNLGDQNPPAQYLKNSRLFDIKNVFSKPDAPFPNTLPSSNYFEEKCQQIGINKDSIIVVYDSRNTFSSPRVWWLFKTMGHQNVAVLNGGLQACKDVNVPMQNGLLKNVVKGNFEANYNEETAKDFNFIKQNLATKKALVIDARSADRFLGNVPEPRKGLRSGHIPGSINIPYKEVLNTNGTFKSVSELKEIFKNIPSNKPLVFSCGSGVTACILYLAAQQVLNNTLAIYDGSWTEWGSLSDT